MGEINLTKSARKSIRLIYKEYKRRIRSGVPFVLGFQRKKL